METKKLTNIIVDGVINFAVNSFLNIFNDRKITVENVNNNQIKVFLPLKFNNLTIKEESTFKAYLNSDLHYLMYIIGTTFVDNEIINKYSLYYLYNNKIIGTISGISFDNENEIVFSLLEKTNENEYLEYLNVCTIHVLFESGNIVLNVTFTNNIIA